MRALLSFLLLLVAVSSQTLGQSPTLPPTPNLVIENVPPIPVSLIEEVRRYTEARLAVLADWHPTKREMLITTRFGNTPQIHQVKMPGGARTQITFFTEPVVDATYEPKQGRYFLFGRDVGGNEFAQLYRYDLADGRVTLLSDGGRSQNGRVVWSNAGDRAVYSSTRRNGADRDIWIIDPTDAKSNRLLLEVSGGGWGAMDWAPDDSKLVVGEYLSITRSKLWMVDVGSGKKTLLTRDEEEVAYSGAEFAPDGRGLYVTTDKGSEFQFLAYMNLADKSLTPLTSAIKWDIDNFDLSHDGKTIAFTANEAGISKLYLLDTATRKYKPVEGVPLGVIGAVQWHRNSRDLGLVVNSARSTSDVYSLDAQSGRVTRWTESELGGLVASELSEPELIRWKSFDGREITGFYYRPPQKFKGPRPVIIDIHGGPEGQSRPTFQGRKNYFLNELGVAIIYPNVRGSLGYGKTFVSLDNGLKREDSVKDIGALLDWIAKEPSLDAERIMVTGGSYGGYMTLAVATHYNDRIRCALDIVGISHFGTFLKNTESYRRDLRRVEYGDERDPKIAEFFERTAPLNNAQKITKPLFVVQGGNDPRVPLSEAEQIVDRVKSNGGKVWYLMAKDEGHGFRKKNNADYLFYATVLFVKQNLLK